MPRMFTLALSLAGLLFCSAATTPIAPIACGSDVVSTICFGRFDVPETYAENFTAAGQRTIDAIYSDGFAQDLKSFIIHHSSNGPHADAWKGADAAQTVHRLKAALPGQTITTYGGLRGRFLKLVYGNIAFDGLEGGPIQFNRAALPRPVPSIANTLAHEIAHRSGLTHPSSAKRMAVGRCEPPYVIGTLVEKRVSGRDWRPGPDDCPFIDN